MVWLAADFETDVADGLLVGELGWLFFFSPLIVARIAGIVPDRVGIDNPSAFPRNPVGKKPGFDVPQKPGWQKTGFRCSPETGLVKNRVSMFPRNPVGKKPGFDVPQKPGW